jgi:hypothetical protein
MPDERVQLNDADQVMLDSKTPWRDVTTHLMMSRWSSCCGWQRRHRVSDCAAPDDLIAAGRPRQLVAVDHGTERRATRGQPSGTLGSPLYMVSACPRVTRSEEAMNSEGNVTTVQYSTISAEAATREGGATGAIAKSVTACAPVAKDLANQWVRSFLLSRDVPLDSI